ncbi:hypothetical protein EHV15_02850 [Paenibacillus oralis]|uniref:Uncharacterized protein n=1 Tax=Paenibacillus oralis TaxID=2490856 RepID=A0A3P3TW16_9BACL|nr:hypothetical protein [Paenibacillus oralis]RRJ62020.1 hypothetical protein EHV15_02850 [Paenibacillus oralis]
MSENNEPRKIDLAEAMRQKLAQKKQQQQAAGKPGMKDGFQTKALKSQNNKKPNNQRRRTGGS